MEKSMKNTNFSYSLHHTKGASAEESTLGYLDYPTEFKKHTEQEQ